MESDQMLDVRTPFNSTAELMSADALLQDEAFFKRTVLVWSRYDEKSASSLTREILKRVLSNSLASKFVLCQDGGVKETFEKLLIFRALKAAVMKTFPATEKEISAVTSRWLTASPFRKGGAGATHPRIERHVK